MREIELRSKEKNISHRHHHGRDLLLREGVAEAGVGGGGTAGGLYGNVIFKK